MTISVLCIERDSLFQYCLYITYYIMHIFVGRKRSRRGKLVQMIALKPRDEDGSPKRTPPNLGDPWQKHASYAVEQVSQGN